jgi:hypothetical protein
MIDILSLVSESARSDTSSSPTHFRAGRDENGSLFECALSVDVAEWSIVEDSTPIVATAKGDRVAVARGKNLCIIGSADVPSSRTKEASSSSAASLDVIAEVEFEHSPVCAICWVPSESSNTEDASSAPRTPTPPRCLIVGDQAGSIHFLLSDTGEVILSKKLIQG